MFKFRFNPLQPNYLQSKTSDDGYFGWTDRYGIRPLFTDEHSKVEAQQKPFFIANY